MPIDSPRYLTVQRPLEGGHVIQFEDLEVLPGRPQNSEPSFTDQDLSVIRGAVALKALEPGKPISYSSVEFSARAVGGKAVNGLKVPAGWRAYPLPVSSNLELRPGDRIDIFAKPRGSEKFRPTALLLEAVLVLKASEGGNPSLIVALDRTGISEVELAAQRGGLTVALRHPDEPMSKVRNRKNTAPVRAKVQIVSEGA
jgi:Flp pilus assembly protein CpaB